MRKVHKFMLACKFVNLTNGRPRATLLRVGTWKAKLSMWFAEY